MKEMTHQITRAIVGLAAWVILGVTALSAAKFCAVWFEMGTSGTVSAGFIAALVVVGVWEGIMK